METKDYYLEITSNPDNLDKVDSFVKSLIQSMHLNDERVYGILLSVSEATTNAIVHANKKDPSKIVKINITISPETLRIAITDQGVGFDPNAVPDPTTPENILKDSGRGLYLMRIYAASLKYELSPNGTTTILEFKL